MNINIPRRDVAEMIFDYVKKNGFKPENIQYGDSYFIFDKGEDGVVHFTVRGLHGWKFAMWINTNEKELVNDNGNDCPSVQFFCQHKDNIDKFKPARSYFCVDYSYDEVAMDVIPEYTFYRVTNMLKMIKKHPFASYNHDLSEDDYLTDSNILTYITHKWYVNSRKLKEFINDFLTRVWHGWKLIFISRHKIVDSVSFIDNNSDGWKSSPRYDVVIKFKSISNDEDIQSEKEFSAIKFWYKKNYYDNICLTLRRDGLDNGYCYDMESNE